MATVTASEVSKHFGDRHVLRKVSFKLERGERMALSGRNGTGKTTLLRILAGEASMDSGALSFGKGVRVSLHDQRPPRAAGLTLSRYVISALDWVLEIEAAMNALEASMAGGASDAATLDAYAEAQGRLEHAGGYRWRDGVTDTIRGLGFGEDVMERELASFSGGELTRASLARALAGRPDLLLLDEPTNHLDIASLEWLEAHLAEIDAAVVLVAHDRWFLESVGTSVLDLAGGRARFFQGPWHAWRTEQAVREIAAGRDVKKREAEIARLERFVERFRAKSTLATRAKSKAKQIERIKRGASTDFGESEKTLSFSFGAAERSGRVVMELEDARLTIGERTLLEDGAMWLERGEHVCLIGPNGAGKSTLIAALAGARELDGGKLRMGHNVKLGLLSQHAETPDEPGLTALVHAQRATGLSEAKVRALLGRFLFSGDDVVKLVSDLSGGEAQRLSLALLVTSDANLLVLDEPTNHLDVESREALEDALARFDGTLLMVSHDRALLEAVGTRTVAFEEGTLRNHPGGWAEYRAAREERDAIPVKRRKPDAKAEARRAGARDRAEAAGTKKLEREIENAERELKKLEDELADPGLWEDAERAAKSTRHHERAKKRLEELLSRWERVAG